MVLTPTKLEAIFADLTAGVPLRKALKKQGVDPTIFYRRINADEEICQRYVRAKSDGMDAIADDAMEIADTAPPVIKGASDPGYIAWQRLRVDTRKWLLAKLAPKKYGEKTLIGSDPENPIPPLVVLGTHGEPSKD